MVWKRRNKRLKVYSGVINLAKMVCGLIRRRKKLLSILFFACFLPSTVYRLPSTCLYAADTGAYSVKAKVIQGVWELWDDCDSHKWINEDWGAGISTMNWVLFDNKNCLEVSVSTSGTENWALIRSSTNFHPEDWGTPISSFNANVYVTGQNNAQIKLEVYSSTGGGSVGAVTSANIPKDTWTSINWALTDISSHVAKIDLVLQNLTTPRTYLTTFYIDTLILGTTIWDNMDDSSYNWAYGGDAVTWANYEAITHNQYTSTSPAGSIYLNWDASTSLGDTYAKVYPVNDLNQDWSRYIKIKAQFYCSDITTPIKIGFWDGTNYLATSTMTVSSANTWEAFEWDLPSGTFIWSNILKIEPQVITDIGPSTGEIYIDDIQLYK